MTKKIKLFCIPYAGGSANMYNSWKSGLNSNIELCPIELAGRGNRITENPYQNLEEALEDIYDQVSEDILNYDYAIFGHSLGAMLAYELTQKITSIGLNQPMHVFFSGRKPPHIHRKEKWSLLSSTEFEKKIMLLGGTPPEFFKYPELKEIFIPLLRSDFSLSETIVDRPEIIPLDTDISILLGEDEGIPPETSVQWYSHTTKKCNIQYFEGNHFFLLQQKEAILEIINENLVQESLMVAM
ncbi:thioesterase domain-containing protein [Aquimarina sp. D1M17]|uniref:thioesterase II family protein n=1 Tax=Aquimarina acroporae TaxID=2937283 RepID=UPI0020BF213D|nr:thioesterase domain-containing protein [Aquimarina acroporae]MCK8521585.1 thioesterase domain-containing protein [Aquimarina acroporae]